MRKSKPEDSPPSKAYLVSFGDTMTALLAFFIVLLSLAEEQSGMKMHVGTGSFVRATQGVGLPGAFTSETSARAVHHDQVSPLYLADDLQDRKPTKEASGPDQDNGLRSIDREMEVFKRFLNEMDRLTNVEQMPETKGEVVFDIFNSFSAEPPYLKSPHREAIKRALHVLRKDNYRVELVVWANSPSPLHWDRAIERSVVIVDEVARWAQLDKKRQSRLMGLGRPWKYADVRRPVMSVIIRKLE